MAVATVISVEEYLRSSYDGDCDFLEGHVVERNVGELDHSDVQSSCLYYLGLQYKSYWCGVEVRVEVKPNRFLVPDVTLVSGGKPKGRIITSPPTLTIEVFWPDDRAADLQDRIDDYLAFGVPTVWVINPVSRRAFVYTADGMREAKGGFLRTADGVIEMPLTAIFAD
jgi:Uma2 family endonuclease